jgi:hypothetical protein
MIEMSIVVLQCSMDLMKVELDPDGEPYPMSENGNHLIEVKQEKDPLFLTSETENEVSCVSVPIVGHIQQIVTLDIRCMTHSVGKYEFPVFESYTASNFVCCVSAQRGVFVIGVKYPLLWFVFNLHPDLGWMILMLHLLNVD